MTTFKESVLILLFEFLGTLLLTALICATVADVTGLICGFFILLIFSARISGSHFNPAITLAFMFRRDTGRFSRLLGILYIAAQYGGALLGSLLTYNLFEAAISDKVGVKVMSIRKDDDHNYIFQGMIVELLGTMILTFLYLTQTEEKTKMSGDPAITTLIIAATYTAICVNSLSPAVPITYSPFNPAAALGITFSMIFKSQLDDTNNTWVFLIFGYIGSLLAVLLFEFVYKKAMTVVEDANDDDDEEQQEHDALITPSSR